ncbi:E3 SUMO-protein ligase PIAS2-like isoform X2 [Amphiura filiformis]|uniref:E3 SUMO-protein ligase PIAS2-like isoform X2 n=1 Tax=Amphiura filiformis TaxID=82378 RepID=UPI003B225DDE
MADYDDLKHMIMSFRVSELQVLLGYAGRNKSGRKHELQARALNLLKNGCATPVQIKIKDLYRRRFPRRMITPPQFMPPGVNGEPPPPSGPPPPYSSSMQLTAPPAHQLPSPLNPCPPQPIHPDVKFRSLPFYDPLGELLKPTGLMPPGGPKFREVHRTVLFHLSPAQINMILDSRDPRAGIRLEYSVQVQLRFCLAETSCEQDDKFPASICVKVNSKLCPLPPFLPQTKAGAEPKRPSRPVNITPLTRLSATHPNQIEVQWLPEFGREMSQDEFEDRANLFGSYCVGVYLVRQVTSETLLSRLRGSGIRNGDHSRALIKEKLHHDPDSEIATTSLRVSLMCPLGKMRMTIPCRAITCTHLQCFDASLYLQMNEKKPTWICPVCDQKAPFNKLVIDGLFLEILNAHKPPQSDEIQFLEDGTWRSMPTDRKPVSVTNTPVKFENVTIDGEKPAPPSSSPKKKRSKIEIIDLTIESSSDEDDLVEEEPKSETPELVRENDFASSIPPFTSKGPSPSLDYMVPPRNFNTPPMTHSNLVHGLQDSLLRDLAHPTSPPIFPDYSHILGIPPVSSNNMDLYSLLHSEPAQYTTPPLHYLDQSSNSTINSASTSRAASTGSGNGFGPDIISLD